MRMLGWTPPRQDPVLGLFHKSSKEPSFLSPLLAPSSMIKGGGGKRLCLSNILTLILSLKRS